MKTKRKFKTSNHFLKIPEPQFRILHTKVGRMQQPAIFCSDRKESVCKSVCVTFSRIINSCVLACILWLTFESFSLRFFRGFYLFFLELSSKFWYLLQLNEQLGGWQCIKSVVHLGLPTKKILQLKLSKMSSSISHLTGG